MKPKKGGRSRAAVHGEPANRLTDGGQGLGELIRELVPSPIIGLRPFGDASSSRAEWLVPRFEDDIWKFEITGDNSASLTTDLLARLEALGQRSLFLDVLMHRTDRRSEPNLPAARARMLGGAAMIDVIVRSVVQATPIVAVAPASIATASSFGGLRQCLTEAHRLSWLIFAGGEALPGMHPAMRFILFVCNIEAEPTDQVRIVDLRRCGANEAAREIRAAKARRGGEVGRSLFASRFDMASGPWTYERFTAAHRKSRRDSAELGNLTPLSHFVEHPTLGLNLTRDADTLEANPDETQMGLFWPPPGRIPVISGRNLRPNEILLPGRYCVRVEGLRTNVRATAGDLLLRTIAPPSLAGPKLVAAIVPPGLDAAIGEHVAKFSWQSHVSNQARELIVAWLMSERASEALAALAVGPSLNLASLLNLHVPDPSPAVMGALEHLHEIEVWYAERAEHVRHARSTIFSASNYGLAVGVLLETQKVEGERVTAAKDCQRLKYRIRNYFPHPIALRYERLQVHPHGEKRLDELLECAEHLVHYLAVCGLVQLRSLRSTEALPSRHLMRPLSAGNLRFSWGLCWEILKEAVEASRRHSDPLALAIPSLAAATEDIVGAAEFEMEGLFEQRNAQAHLHTLPEQEVVKRSEELALSLDKLMVITEFIAEMPPVYVRDYYLDEISGQRSAIFDVLRGASVVFQRETRAVRQEIPRHAVGLVDSEGRFFTFSPWILLETCQLCKRPEIFLFNRLEGDEVTYTAMESGHPWRSDRMAAAFRAMTAGSKASDG
jgi:hypothetical protein